MEDDEASAELVDLDILAIDPDATADDVMIRVWDFYDAPEGGRGKRLGRGDAYPARR